MTFDVGALAPDLERRENGIWFARPQATVSYPSDGNTAMLLVEDRSFWFRHRNRCVISLAKRFAPDGTVLDIGGGNGFVAKALVEAGFACAVLEPGLAGALAARMRGIDPVICACLQEGHLPPSSIAAAGLFDVVEHIANDAAFLAQVYALLRPGGLLFVTVPAYQILFSAEDVHAGHYRRYTLPGLRRTLVGAGFKMAFASYIFAPLPPLIFLRRRVVPAFGRPRGEALATEVADHSPPRVAEWLIERCLRAEARRIDAGGTISFGASCLAVAVKAARN